MYLFCFFLKTVQAIATSVVSGIVVVEYNFYRNSFRKRQVGESGKADDAGTDGFQAKQTAEDNKLQQQGGAAGGMPGSSLF